MINRSTVLVFVALLWAQPGRADDADKPQPPAAPLKRLDLAGYAIADREPIPLKGDDAPEIKAYQLVLSRAWRTSLKSFADVARRDVAHEELLREPARYRGEVVHVEGLLTQLRQRPAPKALQKEGLASIYMGWLSDPLFEGHKPVTVIFPNLPKGLEPGEDLHQQ